MADKRINALTTTSASVGDDYFAIDGATNGTRALSAFSPTFGGNATVGGTLTVSGNTTLSGNLDVASGISTGTAQLQIGNGRTGSGYAYVDLVGDTTYSDYGFRIIRNNGGANTSSELAHRGTGDFALVANDAAPIKFYTNGVTAATIAATTGNTTIHSTTASLGTSSGALVVGNGTQGGLGVGGAIYAGDTIETTSGSNRIVLGATNYIWHYRSGADGQLRLTRGGVHDWDFKGGTNLTIASDGTTVFTLTSTGNATVTGDTNTFGTNSSSSNSIKIITGVGSLATPKYGLLDFRNYNDLKSGAYIRVANRESDTTSFLMNVAVRSNADVLTSIATFSDTQLAVLSSTPSISTSSGALVVSGGVGVDGAIYAGGSLNVASSSTALTSLNSSTSGATGYNQASFTLDSGGTPKTAVLGVQDTGAFVGTNTNHDVTIRTNTTTRVTVSSSDVTIASGVGLKLGNAYVAGAPTATGYIVIKDSTGTSYKIPAVAL